MSEFSSSEGAALAPDKIIAHIDRVISHAGSITDYRVCGFYAAPDASDRSRPLAVYSEAQRKPTQFGHSGTYRETLDPDETLYSQNLPAPLRMPDTYNRDGESWPLRSFAKMNYRNEPITALKALKRVVSGVTLPIQAAWYGISTKEEVADTSVKGKLALANSSALHVQLAIPTDSYQREVLFEAIKGRPVDPTTGLSSHPITIENDPNREDYFPRAYRVTVGFGAIAYARQYYAEQGFTTIPKPIPQMAAECIIL